MSYLVAIIVASLGSTGLFSLIERIIDKRSGKNDRLEAIERKLEEIAESSSDSQVALVRMQLLNLIQHTPNRDSEILTVAKRYFDELNGNWYMESFFTEWAGERDIPLPTWFKE